MRSTLFIGILIFSIFFCNAQNNTGITILPKWKKGETKNMTVIHDSNTTINGEENKFPSDTTDIYSIKIIDKTNEGFILEWKIVINNKKNTEVDFLKEYMTDFKYVIVTDSLGRFKELQNWESLIEMNKKLKENFISSAKKENVNESELNKVLADMKIAETKNELVDNCINLTNIFFAIYGEQFSLNDTIYKPTTIPNQYVKEGIPATIETITKSIDDNKISIKYSNLYDYAKLKELQKIYFPNQEYTEQKSTSYIEYTYNLKTGWIENIILYGQTADINNVDTHIVQHIIK